MFSSDQTFKPQTDAVDAFWHEGMLQHDAVEGVFDSGLDPGFLDVLEKHPENADRVRNMVSILQRGPIAPHVNWLPGRLAIVSELLTFHTSGSSIDRSKGRDFIDFDLCFLTYTLLEEETLTLFSLHTL